ncbi:MAG: MDR family MFS transporter [Anaerolineaceae bacterium]|nr:MDR family MFS transporter [Anaerolineaceae bacterium]OQY89338.1 MAG: MFS transporter [Anaerolineae bacterium UTCFX1]
MTHKRIVIVTIGIMFSLFLASMESTVVATAMPTIVGQLGGLKNYSWVFSAYMLTSTTTVPLYGKISDIYGRRKLYVFAMLLFLIGSLWCGAATTLTQLIFARALQGVGAGGIMPLAFIIIGEMFSLEQRTKMQGLFSGVWGVSSVAGPLLGGFIVDQLSWRWVFYINVIPGLIAGTIVALAWKDQVYTHERLDIDYAGAALLSASVVSLLLGLMELGTSFGWAAIAISIILFAALIWVEFHATNPILPIGLFRDRLFSTATSHSLFTGWAVFGTISFIPLFVQSALGASPTQAGVTITPMLLSWVTGSIFGTRILLKIGYRRLSVIGTSIFFVGASLLALFGANSSQTHVMVFIGMMGLGMGLSIPSYVIAVQTTVERRHLGTATSMLQFSRSMGGTLGVSVMGAALSAKLASSLSALHLDAGLVSQLLDPAPVTGVVAEAGVRLAMTSAIHIVFVIAFVAAALGWFAAIFTPHKELTDTPISAAPIIIE